MTAHPDIDTLRHYLSSPANDTDADLAEISLHLASCQTCRRLADTLSAVSSMSHITHDQTIDEQQAELISRYLDGTASNHDIQQTEQLLASDASALKSALHYVSHKSAADRDMSQAITQHSAFSLKRYLGQLFMLQTPAWITAPVAAGFIGLLSYNLIQHDPSEYQIASYQDNPVVTFTMPTPGIGFFTEAGSQQQPYAGMTVKLTDEQQFELNWPAIDNALAYYLKIHVLYQGKKLLIADIMTDQPAALIQTGLDHIDHRYEWSLMGETRDNQRFRATGGFVISQQN